MPKKRGRPSKNTLAVTAEICRRLGEGETLRQICADAHLPNKSSVLHWLLDDEVFRAQYARAREIQAEHQLDEILEIADDSTNDWIEREVASGRIERVLDHESVQRSKLRVDARKWAMSHTAPKKYGDRVQQQHSTDPDNPLTAQIIIVPAKTAPRA